jgi:hypothetical protein
VNLVAGQDPIEHLVDNLGLGIHTEKPNLVSEVATVLDTVIRVGAWGRSRYDVLAGATEIPSPSLEAASLALLIGVIRPTAMSVPESAGLRCEAPRSVGRTTPLHKAVTPRAWSRRDLSPSLSVVARFGDQSKQLGVMQKPGDWHHPHSAGRAQQRRQPIIGIRHRSAARLGFLGAVS